MMPKSALLKNQVRIIAGQYRRRLLPVVNAPESCQLRPTPDRVRQTVFNWLEHFIPSWHTVQVIDAFAGTGALGLEAASRGAKHVLLCDTYAPAIYSLQETIALLQTINCSVQRGDALTILAHQPSNSIDLLLLDPPFNSGVLDILMPHLSRILTSNALLYIESEVAISWPDFTVLRHLKAGVVHAQLLQLKPV